MVVLYGVGQPASAGWPNKLEVTMPRTKAETETVTIDNQPEVDTSTEWEMYAPLVYRDWPEAREYFYDGELFVANGEVKVPKSRPEWAHRLLQLGYTWKNGEPEGWTYDR